MLKLLKSTTLGLSAGLMLGACGTAAVQKKDGPVQKDEPVKKDDGGKKEDDPFRVKGLEQVEDAKYVEGIPENVQDAFRRGTQLASESPPKYAEAAAQFEDAIKLAPDFLEPYFNLATVYEQQRQPDKALEVYQRALKQNPDSYDAKAFVGKNYLAKAKELLDAGKAGEAEQTMAKAKALFDEVLTKDFENVPANNALALYWLLKGDVAKAEEHVKQVLTIQPFNVTALNTRGLIYLNQNELNIAQWIFEQKVLSLDQNSAEAFTNLGIVYVRQNELPKAVGAFKRAVDLDPTNVAARMNLGAIYLDFMNYKPAKEQFDATLKLQPNNVEALIGQATSTLGLHNAEEAIGLYEKVVKMDERRAILLFRIGDQFEKNAGADKQKIIKAIDYYERYVDKAKLPATDKLVNKIKVMKDALAKGLYDAPPPTPELKEPKKDKAAPPTEPKKAAEPPKAEPPKAEEKKADEKKADEKSSDSKGKKGKGKTDAPKADKVDAPEAPKDAPKKTEDKKEETK